MKQLLTKLDKAFENRVRLGIMSGLIANEQMDFTSLKKLLEVSDGNLASHLKSLEKLEYIEFRKKFVGRKPNTSYFVNLKGREAFENHRRGLKQLLKL